MMKFQITSMTPEERLYAYSQSSQIEGQTGCIGYLRGDFGAGQEFYTSWFDRRKEYKDGEFKAEFDEVVNALREKDGLLCSRASMNRFCCQHPEAEFEGNYCTEYGFKVQTSQHTYTVTLGADVFGNIARLDNALENLAGSLQAEQSSLEETKGQLENARAELGAPFAREEELAEKTARLNELNVLLKVDEKDKTLIDSVPDEGEEVPERKVVGLER